MTNLESLNLLLGITASGIALIASLFTILRYLLQWLKCKTLNRSMLTDDKEVREFLGILEEWNVR